MEGGDCFPIMTMYRSGWVVDFACLRTGKGVGTTLDRSRPSVLSPLSLHGTNVGSPL